MHAILSSRLPGSRVARAVAATNSGGVQPFQAMQMTAWSQNGIMILSPMRIISRKALREFWRVHPQAEQPLRAWYAAAKEARWRTTADVKATIRSADFLKGNRIVFNVAGNKYRLVVKLIYEKQRVYIRFIGTHAEYDKIDATRI
jgi:mRNA interferase HigB